MNPHATRRAWRLGFLFLGVAITLGGIVWAMRQQLELYQTPNQWQSQVKIGSRIQLGGVVKPGSVRFDEKDSANVSFEVTDYEASVHVHYHGLLPALFREGKGIVVKGIAERKRTLKAYQVLAKHDENYQPPSVSRKKA